jgi:hypothetical protein
MAYACEFETSLMYYFKKDIREDLIEDVMISQDSYQNVDMFSSDKINIIEILRNGTVIL